MPERGRFEGMWKIVRFNWPLYAAALAVLIVALCVIIFAPVPLLRMGAIVAGAGAGWFLAGSLGVSHIIYDCSDLHRGAWLAGMAPRRAAVCHCGYDEISALLRAKLPAEEFHILDHYDETTMSEPSIRRARRLFPPAQDTTFAPFSSWPVADASLDAVFGVLAIHELRRHEERATWFAEAHRCLAKGGRVVLVEHLRDFANFAAFGPGFVHFHSTATWRQAWESAGLQHVEDFRITAFLRVFILRRHD